MLFLIRRGYFMATLIFVQLLTVSCLCSANNISVFFEDPLMVSRDSITIDFSKYKQCGEYVINDTLDLNQKTLYLPADIQLVMKKGLFKNGCVVGNNTHLKYEGAAFDRVHIKGSWLVPIIKSEMFVDLSYDNALKDVFALASSFTKNKIIVGRGDYYLTALYNSDRCLNITNNTEVVIDGNIYLQPNDFANYGILSVYGEKITIKGKGCIVGDKKTHTGKNGEWGMGLYIEGGNFITVKGLTIKDCWGDCIYITGNSNNVIIDNCILDNGRRQGISVISAQNVTIKNSRIQNIEGTKPEYAIDIEPNKNCFVKNVQIKNVIIDKCKGGIASYGAAEGAKIDTVIVKKCRINKTTRCPINLTSTKYVRVESCQINCGPTELALNFEDVENLNIYRIDVGGKRILDKQGVGNNVKISNVEYYIFK